MARLLWIVKEKEEIHSFAHVDDKSFSVTELI